MYETVSYSTTTYTGTTHEDTTQVDVYAGFGIMCDNVDIYCVSQDYYCDGSVVMLDAICPSEQTPEPEFLKTEDGDYFAFEDGLDWELE